MAQSPLYGGGRRYDYRDRLASSLLAEGSSGAPIQSGWQGAARLAQALMGGYLANKGEEDRQGRENAQSEAFKQLYAPQQNFVPSPQGPGPRVGAQLQSAQPTPAEMAQRAASNPYTAHLAPQYQMMDMQAQQAAANRGRYEPVMGDDGKTPIGQRNTATGKIDYLPPGMLDRWEAAAGPGGLQGQRNTRTGEWKPADMRPQTTVNTNVTPNVNIPGEDSFSKGMGTATVDAIQTARTQAQSGLGTIQATRRIQDLLDSGVITGTGAELRLSLERGLATAGLIDGRRVTNTEQLLAEISNNVLARTEQMKGVLTDRDIEFLKDAAAGRISLTPETIRRVSEISERGSMQLVENYNSMVRPLADMQNVPQAARNVFGLMNVPTRTPPQGQGGPPAPAPQQTPPPAAGQSRVPRFLGFE